jgi:LemA protein
MRRISFFQPGSEFLRFAGDDRRSSSEERDEFQPSSWGARMKKVKFSRIAAAVALFLLQPAFILFWAVKGLIIGFFVFFDPALRRKSVFFKFLKGLALISLTALFFLGWQAYNKLIDEEHFVHVAHGRLLVELQRRQDVVARCQSAVFLYADMEKKLLERLITLHRLTKTHGRRAPIVQREGLEIMKLIQGLDLLIEKYPNLKAKGPFVLLMETLQESGFRVISERLHFNYSTFEYNSFLLLFPYRQFSWVFGFKEKPFLMGPLDYASIKKS